MLSPLLQIGGGKGVEGADDSAFFPGNKDVFITDACGEEAFEKGFFLVEDLFPQVLEHLMVIFGCPFYDHCLVTRYFSTMRSGL